MRVKKAFVSIVAGLVLQYVTILMFIYTPSKPYMQEFLINSEVGVKRDAVLFFHDVSLILLAYCIGVFLLKKLCNREYARVASFWIQIPMTLLVALSLYRLFNSWGVVDGYSYVTYYIVKDLFAGFGFIFLCWISGVYKPKTSNE